MYGGGTRRLRASAGVVAALAVSLTVSACGSVVDVLAGRDTGPEVAKVVVLVPDGGSRQGTGEDVLAAVTAALADVDAGNWDVVVEQVGDGTDGAEPLDSAGDAASEVAEDRDVVAVIGGLSPEAVRAAQRPLDERSIAFLSPADDDWANTRGPDPSKPLRPYGSYFRTAVPDGDLLAVAAEYAVNGAGATTVVAVHDGQPREAARLAQHATSLGAEAQLVREADVAAATFEVDAGDGPVAFYLVGETSATDVADTAERSGLAPFVIGGERLASANPPATAGASTFVAVVQGTLQAPADLAVPGLADPGPVAATAYDAGRAVAQMLERCLPSVRGSARDARHGCLSELDTVSITGATGHVTFDPFGDRPGAWPAILVGTDGGWVDVAGS